MKHLTALLLVLTLPAQAASEPFSGVVRSVYDGDTLTVESVAQGVVKVRLDGIDTPELKQPHGIAARDALRKLVLAVEVTIVPLDKDRYGRTVGVVYLDRMDVNAWLVRQGHAWAYLEYKPRPLLVDLEFVARMQDRGLWAERPQAPWDWRKAKRAADKAKREAKAER